MRLSGINYNIVSKMDKVLVNYVYIAMLSSTALTNDAVFNNGLTRSQEFSIIQMSQNLTCIPEGNDDVEFLNVAYNQITNLQDNVFLNNSYRHVKKLFLYRNNIRNISANAFKGLKHLKILDLSDNYITLLHPYTFQTNNKLEKLIIMNNNIIFDKLQTFIVSHTVETLVMSNNKITEIYGLTFVGVPNLKRLVLSQNELTILSPISFKSLRKLHYLSLANTGVHRLTESMFIKLPRIINLENTPLGNWFDPHLRQVTDDGVTSLLNVNSIVY